MSDTYESHTQAADRLQVEREILADRVVTAMPAETAKLAAAIHHLTSSERHLRYLARVSRQNPDGRECSP